MLISVLDDNPTILNHTAELVAALRPDAVIRTYGTAEQLLADSHQQVDILIADICLGEADGIETVKELQRTNGNVQVIYVTGFVEYATRIFETRPCYFLKKPIQAERLRQALEAAEQAIRAQIGDRISIQSGKTVAVLKRSAIRYAESHARKLVLHKSDGDLDIYCKLDDLEETLGETFLRCHKSYLVNMAYIYVIDRTSLTLTTGETVPVSKTRATAAKQAFMRYLEQAK